VGCIAGTLPAVLFMRWLGLKGALIFSMAGYNLASALRLWDVNAAAIYGSAAVAGFFLAIISVGIAVTVSRLTTPSNRALGFSCFFVTTIVAGFFGDAIGGELPGIMERLEHGHTPRDRLFASALLACGIGLAAVLPALFMKLAGEAEQQAMRFPRERQVVRLMAAIAFWSFAVGLFAPFFGVYFSSHLGASVRTIGLDLASGQVVGALFTVFAPMWVSWWGPVRSIRFFMFTAGASAFFMTLTEGTLTSGLGYAIYTGYVAMVQPPINTLLMNAVRPEEQGGASTVNSLFGFSAVAAGGFIGGQMIDMIGYAPMLGLAGATCMAAAVAFVLLVPLEGPPPRMRLAQAA
jgi:predicted MFS family arabinose efflux permease